MLPQADHLSDVFRRHCADRGWTPLHLPSSGAAEEEQLLQELIACREGDCAELSLELIQLAEQQGWASPWLDDNKARAELALGRPELACAIWETLQTAEDSDVAAMATAMRQELQSDLKLQTALVACCRASGWQPRHLGNSREAARIGLGQALAEIVACREAGRCDLSLKLIRLCQQEGHTSPWLEDNQARVEVDQGQFWDAAKRWRQLRDGSDPEAARMGSTMIQMLEEHFVERGFQPEWLGLNNDASAPEALIAVLDHALLEQRSSHAVLTYQLLKLAQEQSWLGTEDEDLDEDLEASQTSWQEIKQIWQLVAQHPDPIVQSRGRQGLERHRELTDEALREQAELIEFCRNAGWKPRHLGDPDSRASIGFEQALLEIIECRAQGATLMSGALIDHCRAMGWTSPWLLDNKARLLQEDDPAAAASIWWDLSEHTDPQVRKAAKEALDLNGRSELEADILRAITASRDQGRKTPWRTLLMQRLLGDNPELSISWRQEAIQLRARPHEAWDLHLRKHRLFLALVQERLDRFDHKAPES